MKTSMMKRQNLNKQFDDSRYSYRFNDKNMNIISCYVIYFNLKIQNKEYFIVQYIRLQKNLIKKQGDKIFSDERNRFGK